MGRKKSNEKQSFESTGSRSDTFSRMFMTQFLSPAFRDLTSRQRDLFYSCKQQEIGQRTKDKQKAFYAFGVEPPENLRPFFTMSIAKVTKTYRLYSETNLQPFYRDLEALIEHGFIKCVWRGSNKRIMNIYQYSDKWQIWGTDKFEITPNEMTAAMLRKRNAN